MRKIVSLLAASAALAMAAPAGAVTLIDATNLPQQFAISQSFTFTATSTSTVLDFQGYQLPGSMVLVNLYLGATGNASNSLTNLLVGSNYTYTPSSCGSQYHAGVGSAGAYGANDLYFEGACAGLYDSLSQTVNTTVGSSYTLRYAFSNIGTGPNGLRITANEAGLTAAVPEPATWAMMLLGFYGIGFQMRRQRRSLTKASA